MIQIPMQNLDRQEIERLLTEQGAGDICYVMSINEAIDGKEMDLKTAIDRVFGYGLSSIISCINGKLAYFQAEQEYGAPPRFILKRP